MSKRLNDWIHNRIAFLLFSIFHSFFFSLFSFTDGNISSPAVFTSLHRPQWTIEVAQRSKSEVWSRESTRNLSHLKEIYKQYQQAICNFVINSDEHENTISAHRIHQHKKQINKIQSEDFVCGEWSEAKQIKKIERNWTK